MAVVTTPRVKAWTTAKTRGSRNAPRASVGATITSPAVPRQSQISEARKWEPGSANGGGWAGACCSGSVGPREGPGRGASGRVELMGAKGRRGHGSRDERPVNPSSQGRGHGDNLPGPSRSASPDCSDEAAMPHGKIYQDVTETVGNTPLIRLSRLARGLPGRVAVKHEGYNPFNSVKDRIGAAMINDAVEKGRLRPGMVIVEPTSGNTGIGLAYVAAARGFRCIFVMPDTMTVERRHMLRALGCKVVLTEGPKGMKAAMARAEEILARLGDRGWMPRQFDNPANPAIHYQTTGPEIWTDTDGQVDIFIAGVGTGGTITGAGRYLRERKPGIHIVAVEPAESPVLSGGQPSPHKQQGIGAGFVPGN